MTPKVLNRTQTELVEPAFGKNVDSQARLRHCRGRCWMGDPWSGLGDGREKPHILIPGLTGAGSKVRELGLLDVAPARPQRAKATRATGTWGGMWGEPGLL